MRFVTIPGTGGGIKKEEDFVVKEVLGKKFGKKYTRGKSGVEKISGPYRLLLVKKKSMTTEEALKKIASHYKLNPENIGFAGLKDKFAITSQYITVKNFSGANFSTKNLSVKKVGYSENHISVGDLDGNEFQVTLHDCETKNLGKIMNQLKKGMPNYFGAQRFGAKGDNQIIGKAIILGDQRKISKKRIKFFINAYQSYIFNKTLSIYMKCNKKMVFHDVPIVGYNTKLRGDVFGKIIVEIMKEEQIETKDFRLKEKITCEGSLRKAFVKPEIKSYKAEGKKLKLNFILPKGSYATILIKEVTG